MGQNDETTQPAADKQPRHIITDEMRAASLEARRDKALKRKDERTAEFEGKRRSAAEVQEAEARLKADRMAPRPCQLTTCQKMFVPKRPQDWKSAFCCKDHQKEFWIEANRLSAAVIKGGDLPLSIRSEYRQGVPHTTQVLDILQWNAGEWVSLRKTLPEINPNVVSKLRQMGYEIETRQVGERPYVVGQDRYPNLRRFTSGGKVEYQYRLVK